MSEANKDLMEKYMKEVALRRKYHEQLVELKGNGSRRRGQRENGLLVGFCLVGFRPVVDRTLTNPTSR